MDIVVELQQQEELSLELGRWEDLEYLVGLLNGAWESREYRLEKVPGKRGKYFFIEDSALEDGHEYGLIMKHKGKAYAYSRAAHAMVMAAYQAYVEEFGEVN